MRKLLVVTAAALLSSIAGSAVAAELPIGVPLAAPVPVFSWSGCYLGGPVAGRGWGPKDITDPVRIAQDAVIGPGTTIGATTAEVRLNGVLVGGQIGCDYQFAPNWLVGVEGAA